MRLYDGNGQPVTRYEFFVDGVFEGYLNRPDAQYQMMKEYVEDRTIVEGHQVTLKAIKMYEG